MFPELPGLILYIYHPHCMYYSQELLVPIWPGLTLYIHSWDFGAALPQLSCLQRALEEWRHFLEGSDQKFEIHTDHKNLSYFREAHKLNCHQAQWSLYL